MLVPSDWAVEEEHTKQHQAFQHGKMLCLILFSNVFSYAQDTTPVLGLELFCCALD